MRQAVQCRFPRGCRKRTRDESGLCHDHRRFSALTWNANGEMTQPRRLSTTMAMLKQDPQYIKVYEAAQIAMDNRVYTREIENGVYSFENSAGYVMPEVEGAHWVSVPDSRAVQLHFDDKPMMDDVRDHQREIANAIRDRIRTESFSPTYSIPTVIGEEYDDEAEIISQLNIGRRLGGTAVTVFDGRNHSEYDMRVRIVPKNAIHGEHYDVSFKHRIDVDEDTGEMFRSFVFVNTNGSMTARNNDKVLNSFMSLVRNIDMYGVRSKDGSKLYMPVGWSDRQS